MRRSKSGKISAATINRTLAILSKMYNDAMRRGYVAASPMRNVSKLHEPEKGFDFYIESGFPEDTLSRPPPHLRFQLRH